METCCICVEKSIYLQKIDESLFGEIKCIQKLRVCVPNEHWEDSFYICSDCDKKLDDAYTFVQLCLKNEEYRKEQLRNKDFQFSEALRDVTPNYTCYDCNMSFSLKRSLSQHITRIHMRPKKNIKREPLLIDDVGTNLTSDSKDGIKNDCVVEQDLELILKSNKADKLLKLNMEIDINRDTKSILGNKEEIKDADGFSDYDEDNNDFIDDFSSEDEIVIKEKKKSKGGKKRGPKPQDPQKCQYCELEFVRTDRYLHHIRSKHTFEKPFKCDLCDAKYYSQHNLKIHLRKHRNEKPFVCSTCGKSFISSNDLWQHNKTHDLVRQYACDECEKSFKTHSNLRTHKLQMHQDPGIWKFVCTVCGKKFPLNNNLIKHMKRHEGIKDFSCHLCDKKFVEKIDLQAHLLSHSNERHFKCSLCHKEYKKKETLRRHMKIEHNMGNFVVKQPEKKLNCPMCPKIFAFKNKLQRHILTHTGEKPVKCDCCDKRFRDNYDRNSHLRQVHQVEPKNAMLPV